MSCEEVLELLSAALDGELTDREQAQLNAHLAQCPSCSALFAQLTDLHQALGELEDVPAPVGFADRVMDQVAQAGPPAPKQPRCAPWKGWAAAAAVVAVVALGAVTLPGQLTQGRSGSTASVSSADASPGDALAQADDPDGRAFSAGTAEGTTAVESEADNGGSLERSGSTAQAEPEGARSGADTHDAGAAQQGTDSSENPVAAAPTTGQAVRGVLTLRDPSPLEGLEDRESTRDAAGNTVYTVPAEELLAYLAQLREERTVDFTYQSGDPDAPDGQIVIAP
jgi:hypothetical protein